MSVLKPVSVRCFEAWRQCCALRQAGEVSLQGCVTFPLLTQQGQSCSPSHDPATNCPYKNVREKPMLGREATATSPFHILIPLHVVCAFVSLQEEAAQTLPFTSNQCRKSIFFSRQPFPLPDITLVQDFVKLSRSMLEIAEMHSL